MTIAPRASEQQKTGPAGRLSGHLLMVDGIA